MGGFKQIWPLALFPVVFTLVWLLAIHFGGAPANEHSWLFPYYVFHGIFSVGIGILFFLLSKHPKWKFQLGFLYLATVFIKLALFAFYFQNSIVSPENLSNRKVFMILIPLFTGLSLEVFFISRLLKKVSLK
ncbi:MAG: DUF6168 family protein [Bacteroidota bacterium]